MSNHQGDAVNRQASQASRVANDRAENDRINAENAAAARQAAQGNGR
jgi:hypothetical protein